MSALARVRTLLLMVTVVATVGAQVSPAQTVAEQPLIQVPRRISDITPLGTGTIIAELGSSLIQEVVLINLRSGEIEVLAAGKCPSLSPDRTLVAFIPGPRSIGDVMVLDLKTNQQRKLTDNLPGNCVAWAPDGRRMAVMSPLERGSRIVIISAETGRTEQIIGGGRYETVPGLKSEDLDIWNPAWRDGQSIAFSVSAREILGVRAIIMIPGAEPTVLYNYGDGYNPNRIDGFDLRNRRRSQLLTATRNDRVPSHLTFSPDGRILLFGFGASPLLNRPAEIWAFDGTTMKLVTNGMSPAWGPDGKSILFARNCSPSPCEGYNLYSLPFQF